MRRLRFPTRLHAQHPGRKWVAAAVLAALSAGLALGLRVFPGLDVPMTLLDDVFYDAFYRARTPEDRTSGDVVLVVVDDPTIKQMSEGGQGWPFPRDNWATLVDYLSDAGAKVIAFDLLFETPSQYAKYYRPIKSEPGKFVALDDDMVFAAAISSSPTPVVLSMLATPDGRDGPMALAVKPDKLRLAAVNLRNDKTLRVFEPVIFGHRNLAVRAVQAAAPTAPRPDWAREPFRLHYYGPNQRDDGGSTYKYVPLIDVLFTAESSLAGSAVAQGAGSAASRPSTQATAPRVNPAIFKDKIVLVGAISTATYDLKSSPLSAIYPGVEVQATAIDNLLHGQYVHPTAPGVAFGITFAGAFLAAAFVVVPRRTGFKLLGALAAAGALVMSALWAFCGSTIYWLPLGSPLLGLIIAVVGAFAWSYYAEDRNRRLIVKAFAQYVSPNVVAQIEKDPSRIRLTGDRHVMTVLFTDIEGFTALSERLPDEVLTELLNFYFDEMSPLVLREDGTLDKYIGDAIMSFWNAPLPQPDHAYRACQAALALQRRESEIQPELRRRGADFFVTRIGINTGPMVVGDMGSKERFNYTVLGDSVNLGSRLEGANKVYGSRILLAQSTADLVKDRFLVRKLDLLQVQGRKVPLAVYELLGETGNAAMTSDEPALRDRTAHYETAWNLYRQQKWDEADAALRALLAAHPADAPAATLLRRVTKLRADPPGEGWDGVYVAMEK